MVKLDIRVVPRSKRDEIAGRRGERIVVRVKAPPVDGRANTAACAVVAAAIGIPKSAVEVVRGGGSRDKTLRLAHVTADELRRALG